MKDCHETKGPLAKVMAEVQAYGDRANSEEALAFTAAKLLEIYLRHSCQMPRAVVQVMNGGFDLMYGGKAFMAVFNTTAARVVNRTAFQHFVADVVAVYPARKELAKYLGKLKVSGIQLDQ